MRHVFAFSCRGYKVYWQLRISTQTPREGRINLDQYMLMFHLKPSDLCRPKTPRAILAFQKGNVLILNRWIRHGGLTNNRDIIRREIHNFISLFYKHPSTLLPACRENSRPAERENRKEQGKLIVKHPTCPGQIGVQNEINPWLLL